MRTEKVISNRTIGRLLGALTPYEVGVWSDEDTRRYRADLASPAVLQVIAYTGDEGRTALLWRGRQVLAGERFSRPADTRHALPPDEAPLHWTLGAPAGDVVDADDLHACLCEIGLAGRVPVHADEGLSFVLSSLTRAGADMLRRSLGRGGVQ